MDKFDFSGWATRNNIKCADGRIIMKDAFIHNDGRKVPLVWNHQHKEVYNVLGHAFLENRPEGVYAFGVFNDTESGIEARKLVQHGDITHLSIYANQLKQEANKVTHGQIREVSLVTAGANPGAYIDTVIQHDGMEDNEAGIIYLADEYTISISHSDDEQPIEHADSAVKDETVQDVFDTLSEKQKQIVYIMIGEALKEAGNNEEDPDEAAHSGIIEHAEDAAKDETVQQIFDTLSEKQKQVVYLLIGKAVEDATSENNKKNDGGNNMKHNVFENTDKNEENSLIHADIQAAIADGKRYGTMKESFLEHGITDIEFLFPDSKNVTQTPQFISREMGWVSKVMGGVHNTPFSRIKSMFADITEDDARAKGYIKGNLKKEEVFSLLKRTTTPQTVYKTQKIDRDDIVDITDFDVISWVKGEMRIMLDEELARAFLVGDGRSGASEDKIKEDNLRPIWKDADLYTIKAPVSVPNGATADQKAKAFIRAAVKSRKNYKGSGSPVLYTTEDVLTDALLMEDTTGRVIYDTVDKLKNALRVSDIVTVPVMENLTRTSGEKTLTLMGIIVNLKDYNVGADKGGAVNMFDDFDIDFNAQKYLIETRCSGALIRPYSAIALELDEAAAPAAG